jgi:hypothetical protein
MFLINLEKVVMDGCKHKDRYQAIAKQRNALYGEQNRAESEERIKRQKERRELSTKDGWTGRS